MTAPNTGRFKHPGFVVCFGLLLGLPVLLFGFPYPTHDGATHAIFASSFAAQFWGGEWYPRWLQDLDGGLGGPTLYFYAPVPYWITSALQPLFRSAAQPWRLMGVSAALALVLSGVFAYAWLRQHTGRRAASVAAILYMAMPYHFAVDLHTRGAFGEMWAFAWMPLILFFACRASPGNGSAFLGLAVSYAVLIMSHLPTTVIFSIVPLAHAVWTARAGQRLRGFVWVAAAMSLGAGLSATYLLPALLEQDAVSMYRMREGVFFYDNNFFFPHPGWSHLVLARDGFERQLLNIVVASAGVGASAWFLARRLSGKSGRTATAFWGVVGLGSLLMMFPVSTPLYQAFAPLQLVQFPWRFNLMLSVSIAALIALGLDHVQKPYSDSTVIALVTGGALLLQCLLFAFPPIRETSLGANVHLHGPPESMIAMKLNDIGEFRPRWAKVELSQLLTQLRRETGDLAKARVVSGSGMVVVREWKPRLIVLALDGQSDMVLEVSQYYYPNWVATLNGATRVAVDPSTPAGLVQLTVPAGPNILELRFAKSKWESRGEVISLACLAILLLLAGGLVWRKKTRAAALSGELSPTS